MAAALVFDHVSKHYRGAREYRALRDDLVGAVSRVVRNGRPPRQEVRALDDVTFEIREGESAAIIGENGAGKTTALKLATRIAYPTDGIVRVRGRVGALIEVGTGMHPELSGRENIGLYGRILGFSRRDVARRFDEIVDFAGIGGAIDKPVKQYSSGMQLRLGFSIAAHLEPDVLVVDEAIAVGDAGFQYRCVERMQRLVNEGRTLIFVSHDMSAVETLCERALLLSQGRVVDDGPASSVVRRYLERFEDARADAEIAGADEGSPLEIASVTLADDDGNLVDRVTTGRPLVVRLEYVAHEPIPSPSFSVGLSDGRVGTFAVASMLFDDETPELLDGRGVVECRFEHLPLRPRTYEIWCSVRHESGHGDLVEWQPLRRFRVVPDAADPTPTRIAMPRAPVVVPYAWRLVGGD